MSRHCLKAQQFDRAALDRLCRLADKLRESARTKKGADATARLLSHQRAVLFFAQPSTRTFLSFLNACHILGIKACDIRDPGTSSQRKGESFEDTVRTFASYAGLVILRHPEPDAAERAARVLDSIPKEIHVINAGSGPAQHPTQALLDIYTLRRSLKKLEGRRIALVGDLKRGRAVRSLAYLMAHYPGVRLSLVSPPEFRMAEDILSFLAQHNIPYQETEDFESALKDADALYMTRVQDEYDSAGESRRVDISRFCLRAKHLKSMKPSAVILHPLPRREEIEPAVDSDPRALYWDQEENGLWIRAALIASLFGMEKL